MGGLWFYLGSNTRLWGLGRVWWLFGEIRGRLVVCCWVFVVLGVVVGVVVAFAFVCGTGQCAWV